MITMRHVKDTTCGHKHYPRKVEQFLKSTAATHRRKKNREKHRKILKVINIHVMCDRWWNEECMKKEYIQITSNVKLAALNPITFFASHLTTKF